MDDQSAAKRGFEISSKAAALGFDWNHPEDVLDKIEEELGEIREALAMNMSKEHLEEEVGDLFFALVNFNRKMQINSDDAFMHGVAKFERRFAALETIIQQSGRTPADLSMDELEDVWKRVKKEENNAR